MNSHGTLVERLVRVVAIHWLRTRREIGDTG